MLAKTLDSEQEAWEFCWHHLPLHEMGPGKITPWTLEFSRREWAKGLERHKSEPDKIKALFSQHVAQLGDARLEYPVTANWRSILASYYDLAGEVIWIQERDLEPSSKGEYRTWARLISRAPMVPGAKRAKAVGGLYPLLKHSWKSVAVITVEAWEADQLIELGADAYAVPTVQMSVPQEMLKWLAENHSGLLFLGPSGEAGDKWARQRVGQCRKLGITADAFLWPKEARAGYTVTNIIREKGKVSVDAAGRIVIECPSAALKAAQERRRTYGMISDIVTDAPGSVISSTAKVIYNHLLRKERVNGNRGVNAHYDQLMFVTGDCRKQVMKALQDLQKWSLIGRIGKGVYQVCTLNEIPQSTLDKLERASEEWSEAQRESKSTTAGRILCILPDESSDDAEEAFLE
jgi:hypothetical protein